MKWTPLEINPLENFFLGKKFERNKPPKNIFWIQECFLITYKSILIKWWDLYFIIDLSKWFINFRLILNILYTVKEWINPPPNKPPPNKPPLQNFRIALWINWTNKPPLKKIFFNLSVLILLFFRLNEYY